MKSQITLSEILLENHLTSSGISQIDMARAINKIVSGMPEMNWQA